jgi:hypothetical protein
MNNPNGTLRDFSSFRKWLFLFFRYHHHHHHTTTTREVKTATTIKWQMVLLVEAWLKEKFTTMLVQHSKQTALLAQLLDKARGSNDTTNEQRANTFSTLVVLQGKEERGPLFSIG